MDALVLILTILVLVFGFGGLYVGRPDYRGAGAGLGNILYVIATLILLVVILQLLDIF